ncbi:transcriptional regulator, TetR family [Pseudooceanicola antarcticus]|uniref:TetR/AcrR family transcriptional regulator n=1 Tax=Pseudooceanicola antarcticus TaxID=1247613 RepID=A0A285HXH4_9RHOB|nr:TetR/AcrR family transcriptional regulator [Pseudooceanicola antarcticus]PJE30407.1 TetR/AcrR family transcriptional regulator [Pseudooceanicola antarcticus]SNY40389.1 transcriptional regulator, TetR family [Pseudooceanicola antarcticus]
MKHEETVSGVKEGRVARRQRRNREALIRAASDVMSEKGIDAATMLEIADRADVGAGTVYNYFRSKDDLAIAVLEEVMQGLALRVESATAGYEDAARIYAITLMTMLETATSDPRWQQLLNRSGIVADVMFRRMGPFTIDLLSRAKASGRLQAGDPELTWRLSTHAIVGFGLAVIRKEVAPVSLPTAAIRLMSLAGLDASEAESLLSKPRPTLPPEVALQPLSLDEQ